MLRIWKGELRHSHSLASEKTSMETSLEQQVELLMREVAALKVRAPQASRTGATETAFDLVPQADKRLRVTGRRRQAVKLFKSVCARYGYRSVRLSEARNPGPPKRLRRMSPSGSILQSTNRFEVLSDDGVVVPSTLPTSSTSGSTQPASASPATTDRVHHRAIGSPRDSDSDDTLSVGRAQREGSG